MLETLKKRFDENSLRHPDIKWQDVEKLKDNPIAKAVKIADLRHNSDLSRLDVVDDKALERVEKYRKAIEILTRED